MGIILRQSMKASIVNYIGATIGVVLILYIYPRYLKPEQIGLLRILVDIALIFALYSQLGFTNSLVKYHSNFNVNKRKQKNIIHWSIIIIPLVGFILFIVAFEIFKSPLKSLFTKNSSLLIDYFDYLIPLTFFLLFLNIFESWSSVLKRIVVPKIGREILIRVFTIVLIVIYYYNLITLTQLIIFYVLIYGMVLVFDLLYVIKVSGFSLGSIDKAALSKPLVKGFGFFSLYILGTGIFSSLVGKVDSIMLSSLSGLAQTGIYSIALYIATFIDFPSRSVIQISSPIISEALKKDDYKTLDDLYHKNSQNQIIITGIILILILINASNFFKIMPNGEIYSEGILVVIIIGVGKFFDCITSMNLQILTYSKYYYYTFFIMSILSIIAVILNYFLIKKFGINGAATAFALSYFIFNGSLLVLLKKKFSIAPFTMANLKALLLLFVMICLGFLIPRLHNAFIDIILRSSITLGIYLFLVYKFKLSEQVNATIKNLLFERNLKKFFFG